MSAVEARLRVFLADGRLARALTWLVVLWLVTLGFRAAQTTEDQLVPIAAAAVFLVWEMLSERLGAWGLVPGVGLVALGLMYPDGVVPAFGAPILALVLPVRLSIPAMLAIVAAYTWVGHGLLPPGMTTTQTVSALLTVVIGTMLLCLLIYLLQRIAFTARRLRDTREDLARTEVDAERTRLAQELNSLMGQTLHQVSRQIVEAREAIDIDDPVLQSQLADVENLVNRGLDQLELLSFEPVIDDLDTEIQTADTLCRRLGVDFTASVDQVDDVVSTTFALLLRECVTNMFKHAVPTRCTFVARDQDGEAVFSFTNDGVSDESSCPTGGTGQGRCRESITDLGGTFEAGPLSDGRYRLLARVPVTALASAPTDPTDQTGHPGQTPDQTPDPKLEEASHG